MPGEPEGTAWTGPAPGPVRHTAAEKVNAAARAYNAAVAAGDRAPTAATANALGYQRTQASRLIRQARDRGLIPPAGEAAAQAAAEWPVRGDPVANPPGPRHRGPGIFLDPDAPHPARPARKRRAAQPPDERKDT